MPESAPRAGLRPARPPRGSRKLGAARRFLESPPTPADVARLERATLDAVPPDDVVALDGWLVGLDPGTVGRARSAVPLGHDGSQAGAIERIEAIYAGRGLPATFRLPVDAAGFADAIAGLEARGYRRSSIVRVMTAAVDGLIAATAGLASEATVVLRDRAEDDWIAVYVGDGFDPVDGASRIRLLRRAKQPVYAGLRVPGSGTAAFAAVGFAGLSHELLGIHGMRTRAGWRGRGFAGRLIGALAGRAREAGITTAYLQVEADNAGAVALYARLGFGTTWRYAYWQRPAGRDPLTNIVSQPRLGGATPAPSMP